MVITPIATPKQKAEELKRRSITNVDQLKVQLVDIIMHLHNYFESWMKETERRIEEIREEISSQRRKRAILGIG